MQSTKHSIYCAAIVALSAGGMLGCAEQGLELGDKYSDDDLLPDEQTGEAQERATTAESAYAVALANNVNTTGHGNVWFKVFWDAARGCYRALIWSRDSYLGSRVAYRKWYSPAGGNYFAPWTYDGGALGVEWPPTYANMVKSLQVVDVDLDGDFDVFQLVESSPGVWTINLHKNSN